MENTASRSRYITVRCITDSCSEEGNDYPGVDPSEDR